MFMPAGLDRDGKELGYGDAPLTLTVKNTPAWPNLQGAADYFSQSPWQ